MKKGQQMLALLYLVRKRGFEPRWYCYRQPLKLVRLPVPPLPRGRGGQGLRPCVTRLRYLPAGAAGAGAGVGNADGVGGGELGAGFGAAAGTGPDVPLNSEPDPR